MLVIVQKQPVLGHHDHDPRRLDLIELADGPGQLALDGADVIGALHEIGDAEIRLVKNLKADTVAVGKALRR